MNVKMAQRKIDRAVETVYRQTDPRDVYNMRITVKMLESRFGSLTSAEAALQQILGHYDIVERSPLRSENYGLFDSKTRYAATAYANVRGGNEAANLFAEIGGLAMPL